MKLDFEDSSFLILLERAHHKKTFSQQTQARKESDDMHKTLDF